MLRRYSTYRDAIHGSLPQWPELSWLNRFLQVPKPANGDKTSARIFELVGARLCEPETFTTASSLSRAIDTEGQDSRLRVLLIGHGDSWDVDRDMIDVICSKFDIDPRFLVKHFDYPTIRREKNCPRDFRSRIEDIDRDGYQHKYTWDLGGEIMSPSSLQLGSSFFFTYDDQSLSLAIHKEDDGTNFLIFLRACTRPLAEMPRTFFNHAGARAIKANSSRLQAPESIFELTSLAIAALDRPGFGNGRNQFIAGAVLAYVNNLVGCCNAKYHREIAPQALNVRDLYRADPETLFSEIRQLTVLQRELELFLAICCSSSCDADAALGEKSGQRLLSQLDQLRKDYTDLLYYYQADDRSSESDYLGTLMQAQIDEAKEAKKTSAKIGQLSQLAYVFLPLQLTASAMGMNLETFGTGNIKLATFLLVLVVIATLSFAPVLVSVMFGPWKVRFSRVRDVFRYSRQAGFLYATFCLFHRSQTNDKLWECGIAWDVAHFQGRPYSWKRSPESFGLPLRRAELSAVLKSPPFIMFPHLWQAVLEKLYQIIDEPQWGGKDTRHHTA